MNAREKLRAAIAAHAGNTKAASSARETLARAQAYVAGLEKQVLAFADIDRKIAASRATSIERAISAGKAPTIEISTELAGELAKKIDCENQLAGARQAVAVLEEKANVADADAKRSDLAVEYAAAEVLASEAESLAASIAQDFADLQRRYFTLASMAAQQVRADPETVPPNFPAYLRRPFTHIGFSPAVSKVVDLASALGTYENNTREMAVHDASARAVENFFARLKADSSAMIEDSFL